MKRYWVVAGVLAAAVATTVSMLEFNRPAQAVTASAFTPGNIISDQVFYNSRAMSATQIQSFLNSKYNGCATGYVCLRDYRVTTPTKAAEAGLCNGYAGAVNETAAQIIAKTAASCGINPQVLLVLLQKESSLLTDTTPEYRAVTGYACPDTTGCDATYFGYFNQVFLAARQFLRYRNNPTNYGYVAGRFNYILYNPNRACGGTQVYIQNQATAGLYDYTPYQPNASALGNLNGLGDACGAYGNRNFWVFFNNWFGSTQSTGSPLFGIRSDGTGWHYQNNTDINPGGLPYSYGTQVATGLNQYSQLSAGDLNCDGRPDLIAAKSDGTLYELENSTSTSTQAVSFASPAQIGSGWTTTPQIITTDISGDCRADLLALRTDGTLAYYPNNVDVNPGNVPFIYGFQIGSGWSPDTKIYSADVNGDRLSDIVAVRADGTLWYYRNGGAGDPVNRSPFVYGAQIGSGWSPFAQIVVKDVTGDGLADIVATDSSGRLFLYRNGGSGLPYTGRAQIGSGWAAYTGLL